MKPVLLANFNQRPIIAQLLDGRLMAFFMRTADGVQKATAQLSFDNGYSWKEEKNLFELPAEPGGWGGLEVLVDDGGEVHLFFLNDAHTGVFKTGEAKSVAVGKRRLDIWHVKSENGRKNFIPPQVYLAGIYGGVELGYPTQKWSNPASLFLPDGTYLGKSRGQS